MLQKVHAGHLGQEKCTKRARQVIFCPRINQDIDRMTGSCSTCLAYRDRQTPEPLLPHTVSSRPWEIVASDLFEFDKKQYLVVVDYYSLYPEVKHVPSTSSTAVIKGMKTVFARHEILHKVISDNGPVYDSAEFAKFAEDWDFSHTTASPHHPQANGLAERTGRTVKQIFKKCKDSKQDPLLTLLNYRDTPLECGYSPSQLLMHRSLRTTLPDANRPMSVSPKKEEVVEQKMSEKCRQKHYYDQKTRASELPTLTHGDTVRVRTAEQANWAEQGEIIDVANQRSYVVKTIKGSVYWRNRRHLLKDTEEVEDPEPQRDTSNLMVLTPPTPPPTSSTNDRAITTSPPCNVEQHTTRLGRVILRPKRLIEEAE